jgi:hypothetical protein
MFSSRKNTMTSERIRRARKGDTLPSVHRWTGSIDQFCILAPVVRPATRAFRAERFTGPEESVRKKGAKCNDQYFCRKSTFSYRKDGLCLLGTSGPSAWLA